MPAGPGARYDSVMTVLPLLLALNASAHVARVPVAPARAVAPVLPAVTLALASPLTPVLAAPAGAPAFSFAPDKEAALIAKLAAKLPSQDAASRAKTADWIREIAVENPRAVVQSAALDALATDAEAADNLSHFESLAAGIESFAASTPFDHVFEDAVARLVEAARVSGRAQRASALAVAERIGRSGTPERREKAAALIEGLKGAPGFRMEEDDLARIAARVRAGR